MMDNRLVNYVETEILPRYTTFDPAHRRDHVECVIRRNLELAKHYPVDERIVYVAAAYHDLGLIAGREHHHIVSGSIVENDTVLRTFFSDAEIMIIREAVEDHRASATNEPRSVYGKILAEADRLIIPEVIVRRTVQYGCAHYPELDKEEQYQRMYTHLLRKYSPDGYLRLWLPESDNYRRLDDLQALIANQKKLRDLFEVVYAEMV